MNNHHRHCRLTVPAIVPGRGAMISLGLQDEIDDHGGAAVQGSQGTRFVIVTRKVPMNGMSDEHADQSPGKTSFPVASMVSSAWSGRL